jgi:hypothetical protein
MTWREVLTKYQAQGLTGDDLYKRIIERSVGSRAAVDAAFGLDPKNPPPLPPIRPSAPIEASPPSEPAPRGTPRGPVVMPPPNLVEPPTVIGDDLPSLDADGSSDLDDGIPGQ